MKLSIIVPIYNEEATVEALVRRALSVELPMGIERELLLIDDGSTDGTPAALRRLALLDERVRVVAMDRNRGKGAATRRGFELATGDVLLIQDADLEWDPGEYPRLLAPMTDEGATAVFSYRRRPALGWHPARGGYALGNAGLNALSNLLSGQRLHDVAACFKLFERALAKSLLPRLSADGFDIDVNLVAALRGTGARVAQVEVAYEGRSRDAGKKLRWWRDGWRVLVAILRHNLTR